MNFKFSLLIPLAASALFTPVEKAFGHTVHQTNVEEVQHLICVKKNQYLQCTVEKNQERNQNQGAVQQATETNKSMLVTVVPPQSPNQQRSVNEKVNQYWTTNTIAGLLLLIFVCSSGSGLFLYKKYRTNRVTVLRQNRETLERLWKTSNIQ